jgi:hypothetical protein
VAIPLWPLVEFYKKETSLGPLGSRNLLSRMPWGSEEPLSQASLKHLPFSTCTCYPGQNVVKISLAVEDVRIASGQSSLTGSESWLGRVTIDPLNSQRTIQINV